MAVGGVAKSEVMIQSRVWRRGGATGVEALLSLGLAAGIALVIANSIVRAGWVTNSGFLPRVAVTGALILGMLALTRLPWPVGLGLGLGAAPAVAGLATLPGATLAHLADPRAMAGLAGQLSKWSPDQADIGLFGSILALLAWVAGGWLAWCTLRWRQPLVGLVPGAAALATDVLNFPAGQDAAVTAFLLLTLALLLWNGYRACLEGAGRFRLRPSSAVRRGYWQQGIGIGVGLIVLATLLPPLTSIDRSVQLQNGLIHRWAEMRAQSNHPLPPSAVGNGPSYSQGFSFDAPLAGELKPGKGLIFTYTVDAAAPTPRYFRGVDLEPARQTWAFSQGFARPRLVPASQPLFPVADSYKSTVSAVYQVNMRRPPQSSPLLMFYPGRLNEVDRDVVLFSLSPFPPTVGEPDQVLHNQRSSPYSYRVMVEQSSATEEQLRAAGTWYPVGIDWQRRLPPDYRAPSTRARIAALAQQVAGNKPNAYDAAVAIESHLRANYNYTLTPAPPRAADPEDFFLFSSHEGYCQYFATAMADMLRSLGIPARLVNGYGPGTYDARRHLWMVNESDAHTWPEVFFPGYGWIPFEPTPDGVYLPIERGAPPAAEPAPSDQPATDPGRVPLEAQASPPTSKRRPAGVLGRLPFPINPSTGLVFSAILALGAILYFGLVRYLWPRTAGAVWRRAGRFSRLAGMTSPPGETPKEFGKRLGERFPEAAAAAEGLAAGYTLAAYGPPARAQDGGEAVRASWEDLLPILLRRALHRLLPARSVPATGSP
jgi:transglutaminase-like putative cysteine protease